MQLHNHDLFEKFVRTKFLNTKQCLAGFSPRILLPISPPPPPLDLKRHSPLMLLLLPPSGVDCVVLTEDLCWRLFRVAVPPPSPFLLKVGQLSVPHSEKRDQNLPQIFASGTSYLSCVHIFYRMSFKKTLK